MLRVTLLNKRGTFLSLKPTDVVLFALAAGLGKGISRDQSKLSIMSRDAVVYEDNVTSYILSIEIRHFSDKGGRVSYLSTILICDNIPTAVFSSLSLLS